MLKALRDFKPPHGTKWQEIIQSYAKKKKKNGTIGKENTRKTYNVKLNYVEFFRGLIKNDMK